MQAVQADLNKAVSRSQKNTGLWILLGHPTYWGGQLAAWFGVWLLFSAIFVSGLPDVRTANILADQTLFCLLGLLATHLLRAFFFWFRWETRSLSSLLPRLLVLIFLLSAGEAWIISSVRTALHREVTSRLVVPDQTQLEKLHHAEVSTFPRRVKFWFEFAKTVLTLFAWAGIYFGYRLQQILKSVQLDRLRLDAAVKEAELKTLRSQVNPHFLFNSLNTIRALIEEDRFKAREAVTRLAELFRASLRSSEVETVTLRTELQTVNAYLALEKLRFEERLQIQMDIDPKTLGMSIPPFLLQTLVENALKHGIYPQSAGGVINCTTRALATGMNVSVTNPGRLPAEEKYHESGIANARARLKLIYGPQAALDLFQDEGEEVTVRVFLPQL